MPKKGGVPQNLKRGENFGNAGGGVTKEVRRTKEAFLKAILEREKGGKTVQELVDDALITDILSDKGAVSRMWLVNQQVGMPNAKTEVVVASEGLFHAVTRGIAEFMKARPNLLTQEDASLFLKLVEAQLSGEES